MTVQLLLANWLAFVEGRAGRELSMISTVVSFAAWPNLIYAVVSRRIGLRGKLAALTGGAALAVIASKTSGFESLLLFAAGFLYFAALVPVVWAARRAVRRGHLTRGAVAALMGTLFAVVPAVGAPGARYFIIQLRGWECMFAAFSYAVEGATSEEDPSLADCAFFLLINPTLVHAQRARVVGPPRASLSAALRVGAGISTLAAHSLLFATLDGLFAEAPPLSMASTWSGYPIVMGYYLTRVVAGYWAHSGRASVDIGILHALGFEVPERYRFPFLATGPAEFWRRWNIYVGSWFRRYVFTPAAVAWQRRRSVRWSGATKGAAVVATFLAGGLVHDFSVYLRFGKTALGATFAFAVHGLALILWASAAEVRKRIRVRADLARYLRPLGAAAGCAAFLHVLVLSCWLAIPGMGLGELPRELSAALDFVR